MTLSKKKQTSSLFQSASITSIAEKGNTFANNTRSLHSEMLTDIEREERVYGILKRKKPSYLNDKYNSLPVSPTSNLGMKDILLPPMMNKLKSTKKKQRRLSLY